MMRNDQPAGHPAAGERPLPWFFAVSGFLGLLGFILAGNHALFMALGIADALIAWIIHRFPGRSPFRAVVELLVLTALLFLNAWTLWIFEVTKPADLNPIAASLVEIFFLLKLLPLIHYFAGKQGWAAGLGALAAVSCVQIFFVFGLPAADPVLLIPLCWAASAAVFFLGRAEAEWGRLARKEREFLSDYMNSQSEIIEREKIRTLGIMAQGLSHEINNPLHFIKGNFYFVEKYMDFLLSFALKDGPEASKAEATRKDLTAILSQTVRGLERIEDVSRTLSLMLHFPVEGSSSLHFSRILENTVHLLRPAFEGKARFKTAIAADIWASFNPLELFGLLTRLISNAVEARGDGCVVEISALETQGFVTVTIKDNGPGITPPLLKRVFDPFFTTKDPPHRGMGLSLARSIAEKNGATLKMVSQPGSYSAAILEFPSKSVVV